GDGSLIRRSLAIAESPDILFRVKGSIGERYLQGKCARGEIGRKFGMRSGKDRHCLTYRVGAARLRSDVKGDRFIGGLRESMAELRPIPHQRFINKPLAIDYGILTRCDVREDSFMAGAMAHYGKIRRRRFRNCYDCTAIGATSVRTDHLKIDFVRTG